MKHSLLALIICLLTCYSNSTTAQPIEGLMIDPTVKQGAERHIKPSKEFEPYNTFMQVYLNTGDIQSYENDKMILDERFGGFNAPFKSFYYWRSDTLTIVGAFGIWGGTGFGIEIVNRKARLYHLLNADEVPEYSYKQSDSLIHRLDVPCTDTKIVVSQIPDSTQKQLIYGYVEFNSASYFSTNGSVNGKEILPRKKMRNNMKLYFKSAQLTFEK